MLIYLQMIETDEDKSKFEQIYIEYRGLIFYVAHQLLKNEQNAEDAVSQAFIKVVENITKISEPICPKTKAFIVTIVENKAIDMLRASSRHPTVPFDDIAYGLTQTNEYSHFDNPITKHILMLPVQQRHVIWLKYYQGYTLREIADLMGISLVWAQKLDQRAKKN